MKKYLFVIAIALGLNGCTLITTPVSIAGSVVEATVDVTGAVVSHAIKADDEEEKSRD